MGIFDFSSKKDEQILEQQKIIDNQRREINSLKGKVHSLHDLDAQIEEKEEQLEFLKTDLSNIQSQINFAVCELKNLETVNASDFSILLKENPSKEEMSEAVKMYNVLRLRYSLVKEWMDKYEKDLDLAKTNLYSYTKECRDEIRNEITHELYQRASHCESSMLRHLSSFVENANIEDIRNQVKLHKHIIRVGLIVRTEDYTIKYPSHPIYNMCEDFIQLNIADIIKEMKTSDWETIKMRASTLIRSVDSLLFSYTQTTFDDDYLKSVFNFLEAKYLVIQKQEIEREKEREEREAQREYERAIKKALKDEEKAQEALEQKKREMAEAQTQERIQKLQEQVVGLEKALADARELRERAMSMAQQTKSGYVYIISNIGSFGKNVYKIGMTRRLNPMERVVELSNASVPFPFDVHAFIFSDDAPALEAELHRIFDKKKINSINYRKEYFKISLDEIKTALKERGVHADFTDEPDAFQYRECLLNRKTGEKD